MRLVFGLAALGSMCAGIWVVAMAMVGASAVGLSDGIAALTGGFAAALSSAAIGELLARAFKR